MALIKGIRPGLLNVREAIALHALATLCRETPTDDAIGDSTRLHLGVHGLCPIIF